MQIRVYAALGLAVWLAAAGAAIAAPPANPERGAALYQQRCGACHSLDANRVGPAHRGVFGRRAGAAVGYSYSPALTRLGVIWTEATLDRWLTNPTIMAPGTAMGVRTANPQDRADLIAYLKTAR